MCKCFCLVSLTAPSMFFLCFDAPDNYSWAAWTFSMTQPPNFITTHRSCDAAPETLIIPCGLYLWPCFGALVRIGKDDEQIGILAMFDYRMVQRELNWDIIEHEKLFFSRMTAFCIRSVSFMTVGHDTGTPAGTHKWPLSISYQNVTLTQKGSDEGMSVFLWDSNSLPISSFKMCSYQVAILEVKKIKRPFLSKPFFSLSNNLSKPAPDD